MWIKMGRFKVSYDHGSFRTVSIPDAFNTFVYGSNNHGDFSGSYNAPTRLPNGVLSATWYGFVGNADGITTINLGVLTEVGDISENGIIVGDYVDDPTSITVHGFIMKRTGGYAIKKMSRSNLSSRRGGGQFGDTLQA